VAHFITRGGRAPRVGADEAVRTRKGMADKDALRPDAVSATPTKTLRASFLPFPKRLPVQSGRRPRAVVASEPSHRLPAAPPIAVIVGGARRAARRQDSMTRSLAPARSV